MRTWVCYGGFVGKRDIRSLEYKYLSYPLVKETL